jgi:hypothetical protein
MERHKQESVSSQLRVLMRSRCQLDDGGVMWRGYRIPMGVHEIKDVKQGLALG